MPTGPTLTPSTPLPSSLAQASPGSTPAASSVPAGDGTWTAVTTAGLPQTATLVPTEAGTGTVARSTAFVLTSLTGASAAELAARVVADPPVGFIVTASGDNKAILQPRAVLAAATRYRLSLTRADGTVEASWTALTAGPLHITETIPGDAATNVPLDTGIELTFDQPGVTTGALAKSFSITPATPGQFEAKGRLVAFVPSAQLRKATLYTVTVRHGLPISGAGESLAKDVVFRFETSSDRPTGVRLWLTDALVDATPRERAALTVWVDVPDGETAPTTVPVTVHRLANLDAAMTAWSAISGAPDWTLSSTSRAVATTGLPQVLAATASVRTLGDGNRWIQLPRSLPVGWYVVTVSYAGVPRQLVLQVTDTATYALVTSTRTAVWVRDLRAGTPGAGATATLGGGTLAGSADAAGLLLATTPVKVAAGHVAVPRLLVHYNGATTFRPIVGGGLCGACGKGVDATAPGTDHWWSLLTTDRSQYRQTDTVNLVGVARHRVSGDVPASIRLLVMSSDSSITTPIMTQTVTPDARGMYTAALKISALPVGGYLVRAMVGTGAVGEAWFEVATIRKPAYALTVTLDKHAVISGQSVRSTVSAAFFDGTPVAGVALSVQVNEESQPAPITTDTTGQGSTAVNPALTAGDDSQMMIMSVGAIPTLPEESDITGSSQVAVFAGDAYVTLDGVTGAKTVSITGAVNSVAWAAFEGVGIDLSSVDPRGAARPGATVRVSVTAHYTEKRSNGTAYDFITKRVVPQYDYIERASTLPVRTVRTDASGRFHLVVPTTRNASGYDIKATYTDDAGRAVTNTGWAQGGVDATLGQPPHLVETDSHSGGNGYAVGDPIGVRFSGGSPASSTSRYLFMTVQQGLRSAAIGSSPTFRTTFTAMSVPDIEIQAVRFNGSGFEVVAYPYTAQIDPEQRTLSISLTADKAHYQPGDTATVSITTLGPAGSPVAASVFIRAVDEKLYAIGAATADDPVSQLYVNVPDGVIGSAQSHRTPSPDYGGGGGDTTGGGGGSGRTDFRDWLVAMVVHTDASGHATVSIPLADDLTSWRIAATAVDSRLDAGAASIKVPVGLPFFVDAVIAPQYLVSDRPVLRVRSYGTALTTGTPVTFTISSDTLPMAEATATADAFGSAYIALPALSAGTQKVRIAGSATVGGQTLTDTMTRTFTVVASRAAQRHTTWSPLTARTSIQTGSGMTQVLLADAGRGSVLPLLEELAVSGAVRSDQELASALANRVLTTAFDLPAVATPDPNGLDVYRVDAGLAVVSWGSADLDVTALAAMAGDPRLASMNLVNPLTTIATSTDETRDRRLLALAGLAALGEPVADQIAAAAALTDLTVEEQVNLALAALEAGDETLAGRLEQALLARHGFRYGGQVRLDPGVGADATVATARLAIVAASLGDPVAAEMDDYVASNPSPTTLVDLERALAARGWAERVAVTASSAAITVDGVRQVVAIDGSTAGAYTLTPAQAATASVEPLTGSVLLVQTWDGALDPASLKARAGVTITRTVTPAGDIAADDTVIVEYHVTIPQSEAGVGWMLVDNAPSGLAPIGYYGRPTEGGTPGDNVSPTSMDGQRVEFLVGWSPSRTDYTARYVARVVTAGTYTWESAVLQSTADPVWGITVAPAAITIRTPGS